MRAPCTSTGSTSSVGTTLLVLVLCWIDLAVKATKRAMLRNRVVRAAGRLVCDAGAVVVWLLRAALRLIVAGQGVSRSRAALKDLIGEVCLISGVDHLTLARREFLTTAERLW